MTINLIHHGTSGQRIYSFSSDPSRAASVIHDTNHPDPANHFEVAELKLHDPTAGLDGGFHVNYQNHLPKSGLTEDEVQRHLATMDTTEPKESSSD